MKILKLGINITEGEIKMKARIPYVMSDPIAQGLAKKYSKKLETLDIFEPEYKPYVGQDLTNKKLILWRTGGFGDLLFITPIIAWLKYKYPSCKISVATSERFRDVWENNPYLSHIGSCFSLPIPLSVVKNNDYVGIFEGTIENFKEKDQYCAVDAFAHNLGIYDMPTEFKKPYYFLTSSEINVTKNKLKRKFDLNIYKDKYVCFQWKSSSKHRDYPYQQLLAVMDKIKEKTGYKIVVLTHPSYKQMVDIELAIYNKFGKKEETNLEILNFAGETTYRQSAAVLAHSVGLVGIDSSLTHLAAAFGVPSVSIYGPFKAEWRTLYYKNNISLQKQNLCYAAPCSYHTPPERKDGIPLELCAKQGTFKEYSQEKFCHIMQAVTVKEITDSFYKLLDLQKTGKLPAERKYPCHL